MTTVNLDGADFLASATPWNGIESNPSPEVPWEGIRTLNPTNLGALHTVDSLPKWQGIRNPVTPLTEGVAKNATVLLDYSLAPAWTPVN